MQDKSTENNILFYNEYSKLFIAQVVLNY